MQTLIAKFLLLLMAVTLVVPESVAKRAGGARSVGRQSQVVRQQSAPPPVQRQQPAVTSQPAPPSTPAVQPGMARQAPPPAAPAQQIRQQASSPWGGLLGGALLGLGLGSLIAGDSPADVASQSVGAGDDGATAAGSGDAQADAAPAADGPQPNSLGWIFLLALAALVVYVLLRLRRPRTGGYPRHRHW